MTMLAEPITDEEQGRRLPEGWHRVRLEDVCTIIAGQSPPGETYRNRPEGLPFFQGKADFGPRHPVARTWCIAPTKIALPGDILISVRAPVGPTNVADVECCIGRGLAAVRPKATADRDFILAALRLSEPKLAAKGSGSTFAAITRSELAELEIALPSLSEQQRIAALLTEKMAAVDAARSAAEKQLNAIRQLPAAYLRAAFSGGVDEGLTANEDGVRRRNISLRDVTPSDRSAVPGGPVGPGRPLPSGWRWARLGEVLTLRKDIVHPRDLPKGQQMFVGLEHIESGTGVRTGCLAVDLAQLTGRKPRFFLNDIVYGYLRPYLNKVWIAEFNGLCSVDQYVYHVDTNLADTEFIAWFMRSPVYLGRAPIHTTPGQLPRIRTDEVGAVELELPPLPVQREVVAKLNSQLQTTRAVRHVVREQLTAINQLPAALLRQAFAGGM